ncbi:hypothetical protein JTB14_037496 [Gonioctena quinquepunctata]|nr:hypothetical protein JTB14_037496 [Gonioctena quinquepunctata]
MSPMECVGEKEFLWLISVPSFFFASRKNIGPLHNTRHECWSARGHARATRVYESAPCLNCLHALENVPGNFKDT